MLRLGFCLPPHTKISGYASVAHPCFIPYVASPWWDL